VAERAGGRRGARDAVVLVAAGCLVAPAFAPGLGDSPLSAIAAAVVAGECGARLPAWRSGLAAAALLAVVAVAGHALVPAAITTLAPRWLGRELRRRGRLLAALEQRNRELEAEEDAFARLSVRQERARVARELHDIIGHHLAVIVVQAAAGRVAGDRAEQAAERLAGIRSSASDALAELARLVDVLDADHPIGAPGERIALLLERARSSGVRLAVTPPLEPATLPPGIEDAAHRILQEALTNVLKHAPEAHAEVRLAWRGEALELRVSNAIHPACSSLAATGSGLGLAGMRERVAALGGALASGPSGRGDWVVEARLPRYAPVTSPVVPDLARPSAG
jgi:signal transduction histidine kinase